MEDPYVSVVIPVLDPGPMLLDCLAALGDLALVEVVIVDNGSSDGMAGKGAERHANVRVLRNETNTGFAPACNQGAREARGRYLLFCNSDAVLPDGGLDGLLDAAADDPDGTAWQPVIVGPDGDVENAGERFTWSGFFVRTRELPPHDADPYPAFALTAACLLVLRETFEALGGFTGRYFAYHEDVDLCWRARLAGWEVRVVPRVRVVHHKHATTRRILEPHEARYLTFRNRLRTILADAGPWTLAKMLPLHLAGCLVTAVVLLASGRGRSALSVLRALAWPVRRPAEMARQRREAQRWRTRPDLELLRPDLVAPFFSRDGWRLFTEHYRRWERVRS